MSYAISTTVEKPYAETVDAVRAALSDQGFGVLTEIDVAAMPNFANIGAEFKDPPYDPGNRFCTPYQWGMTGIAYRI